MIETSESEEPIVPAATVVLLRDGEPGLEALLVQRSKAVTHMGGMWVFPGGKVDACDGAEGCDEFSAALAAAIRETRARGPPRRGSVAGAAHRRRNAWRSDGGTAPRS